MTTTQVPTRDGDVTVTSSEVGEGRPFLVLHGGAGPVSVARFADLLAAGGGAQVVAPVLPGFQGTPRPDGLASVRDLAALYSSFLEVRHLDDVTVIGSSIGGWVAAELALLSNRRVGRVVLVDAGGLKLPSSPIADVFALTPAQLTDLSFRNPDKFRIDPSKLSDAQRAVVQANRAALRQYGGEAMLDPTLLERLPGVRVPTLVVWGAADRIYPVAHGEAYAAAIPGAQLVVFDDAGHLPSLETPERLVRTVRGFVQL